MNGRIEIKEHLLIGLDSMDKETKITREILIFGLILMAALLLRLTLLGRSPLVGSEAVWAFQAWQIHLGEHFPIGSQVGYLAFTEILFSLFGGNDFLARFWPVLIGSLIVWVPFILRKRLGQTPALILAAGLAFDPAMTSVSRIAGSAVPALVFLLLAAAAFDVGKLRWLVIFLGLGLFSGPAFWLGSLLLFLTLFGSSLLGLIDLGSYVKKRLAIFRSGTGLLPGALEALSTPLLLIMLVGSFFLRNFQGLSAWAGSLPEFFSGLFLFNGCLAPRLLINLVVSNPFILIFGISGFIFAWRKDDQIGKISSIWFALSLLILLIIPGRQAADLIWLVFPLWVAAARELLRMYQLAKDSWVVYAIAGLIGVLIVLNWLTFTGMIFQAGNSKAVLLQLGLIAASLALMILSMTIAASEWGWPVSLKGLGLGSGIMLLVYMLSASVQGSYLSQGDPRSLWSDGSGAGQTRLLQESIYDASITYTGRGDAIRGVVLGSWDILRWELRGLEGFEYQESLSSDDMPPLIITSGMDYSLVDQEMYRGQDFVLETRPGWDGIIPADWISWIAFRSGLVEKEDIILWIRNDIYSGY